MLFRSLILIAALSLSSCGPADTHEPCTTTSSSSTSSSTGTTAPHVCPPPGHLADVGAECVEDCDCCAFVCAELTDDAGAKNVCAAPCPVAAP
jgi:hypothetical protein